MPGSAERERAPESHERQHEKDRPDYRDRDKTAPNNLETSATIKKRSRSRTSAPPARMTASMETLLINCITPVNHALVRF